MSYTFEEGKDQILNALVKKIKQKLNGKSQELFTLFVQQFFGTMALEDLEEWDLDDLYGAGINFWSLINHRTPDETKIRIYNPDIERNGWQTTHTVVEIICKDMPFLVDSITMVLNRMGIAAHLIVHMGGLRLSRDKNNEVSDIWPQQGEVNAKAEVDAPILVLIDRQTDPKILDELYHLFDRVLEDTRLVVDDWLLMREKVRDIIKEIDTVATMLDPSDVEESKAFLEWIEDHHFTFLGLRDYELIKKGNETILQPLEETGLGVLRPGLVKSSARSISAMTPEARELTLSSQILLISKTNNLASVHRDAYTDYIGVKRFNTKGEVIGERRIIGLYTSAAYNTNPKHIPFLRHKVASIMEKSKLVPKSHAGKILLNILETLPRDDLIQGSEDELLQISMGIFHMQERRRIRMFTRMDVYHRFISCLVFVPRDRFNTELREEMQEALAKSFHAEDITFATRFSESILARIHFIVRINPQEKHDYDYKAIEEKLIEIGRSWSDDLQTHLLELFGEEEANRLYTRYKSAFPAVYMTNFTPRIAMVDIKHIEQLSAKARLGMNFYKAVDELSGNYKLKLYQNDNTIPLADVLPILENLGMKAISERPYKLKFPNASRTWINDFVIQYEGEAGFDFDELRDGFQNAFTAVWYGEAENDRLNQLVLTAGLDWRQVTVLRSYAKYFKQIGSAFGQDYIISALNKNARLAKKLVQLFELRFDPKASKDRDDRCSALVAEIITDLDEVENLDEDKIIRQYLQAISSSLRTNYYQQDDAGKPKPYLSIKLNSKAIAGVPRPHPMFEIFVYSPRFEAVHLRCGKVSRGGIRWSDRKEDFRTEVLGLMKAQQVKNAVIVPSGAKGGFVPKHLPVNGSREEIQEEGIGCYQQFIRGLLDITDNYVDAKLVKPDSVVCYDEDDPYLVVAADKGTATFSDIANAISAEYQFWLGDAFASGGSVGYDHKKMGITARGAWESVKRHFFALDIDVQKTDFTVVGIGDMAGDVFGNGMLLSKHIQLIAAFNHMHIFVDPNPDAATSFKERERLFHLPRSSWMDYDHKLISKGGGVFNRNAKSIAVSKEMREVFDINQNTIEPNELIRLILQAKFDLLWSGGIGTFVKAESQSNTDVGDRTNDSIRINAKQLNCRVVGEGGNLGFTQLGREEYALNGGLIYTDFIDNSGGVSCSDKEVNIKILLDRIVESGDLTLKQRNQLLYNMTDEVAALVLRENYLQTRSINLMLTQSLRGVLMHSRYIKELEDSGKLDREVESLPDENTIMERKLNGKGLTSPAIAVLFCYSKILLKEAILSSNVPEDVFLKKLLEISFPKPLQESYSKEMQSHPLKREIIATKLSNIIVNEMGFVFIYRMQDETSAPVADIVRAYAIARTVLNIDEIFDAIEKLDGKVESQVQMEMMMVYVRLLRRVTRWLLSNKRMSLDISKNVKLYALGVNELKKAIPAVYGERNKVLFENLYQKYLGLGISEFLAHELSVSSGLFASMDIIDGANQLSLKIPELAEIYYGIGEDLDIDWLRGQVIFQASENHWEVLSREAIRDDLDWQQRQLAVGIIQLHAAGSKKDLKQSVEIWSKRNKLLIERWQQTLNNLRASPVLSYTMFYVAVRELLDLTKTTSETDE